MSSSDQRERSRAIAARCSGALGGAKRGRLAAGRCSFRCCYPKKEGAFWCSLWKPDRKSLVKTKQAACGGS